MSNIPSPAATRGRVNRLSTTSRIPGPGRESAIPGPRRNSRTQNESSIPTPRRTSRAGANESSIPTPPRHSRSRANDSSIPTPRRSSRTSSSIPAPRRLSGNAADSGLPTTPRRVSRTLGQSGIPTPPRRVSRNGGESGIPTPRRTSRTAGESTIPTPQRMSRPADTGTRRVSGLRPNPSPVGRRVSSTRENPALRRGPGASSPYGRPTTNADASGRRTTRERALPDRTAGGLNGPVSVSRKIPALAAPVSRQPLKQSPYTRRTSTSGTARGVGSQQVIRKLNMTAEEETKSAVPGMRGLSGISPVARRLSNTRGDTPIKRGSGAGGNVSMTGVNRSTRRNQPSSSRNTSPRKVSPVADRMGVRNRVTKRTTNANRNILGTKGNTIDRGFPSDRVEKQKSVGVKRLAGSALESFRAVRRASLESENADANAQFHRKVNMAEEPETNDAVMADVADVPSVPGIQELQKDGLPDRPDPIVSAQAPSGAGPGRTPGKTFRRTSSRFSDADVCLDNVEKLRTSLGRRRSRTMGDGEAPETPKLRRSSLTRNIMNAAAWENEDVDMMDCENSNTGVDVGNETRFPTRAPFQAIQTNHGTEGDSAAVGLRTGMNFASKRMSIVPHLEGEDWENEDVEDLLA